MEASLAKPRHQPALQAPGSSGRGDPGLRLHRRCRLQRRCRAPDELHRHADDRAENRWTLPDQLLAGLRRLRLRLRPVRHHVMSVLGFVLFLLLVLPTASAQANAQVQVKLTGGPPVSLEAGNSSTVPVQVTLQISGVYCQAPGAIPLAVTATTAEGITVEAPSTIDVPYTNGPVANSPAGPLPGVASPAQSSFNITLGTLSSQRNYLNASVDISAEFSGTLPAGCYAAQPPPKNQASASQTVHVAPRPMTALTSGGSRAPDETPERSSPAGAWWIALAIVMYILARRR